MKYNRGAITKQMAHFSLNPQGYVDFFVLLRHSDFADELRNMPRPHSLHNKKIPSIAAI
jgi:hypothetical protein